MNVVIITAKKGGQHITDKNMYEINGIPLVGYAIRAAHKAKKVEQVYVTTDCPRITRYGMNYGCHIITRPGNIRDDQGDVISHATQYVDNHNPGLENIVVLLGNTVMVDDVLIDKALTIFDEKPFVDSVISVWEAGDDHPYRALQINDNGFVQSYGNKPTVVPINRQDYPRVYYYDQGIWAFRKDCIKNRNGPMPWWWLGEKCYPIIRNWVTGRDVHGMLDVSIAQWWLENSRSEIIN